MTIARADLAIWPAAVNGALLGTDRAPLALPAIDGSLGEACTALARDESDPSAALLRVAAATSAYRRCGWTPAQTGEPLPAQCPPDARPACSPAAASMLRRILLGEHSTLLSAWLSLAKRHGVRPPADTLPGLLELARRDPPLRPLVRAVGGTRAAWLVAFTEEWSFAFSRDDPDVLTSTWDTGTGAARLGALQQLRLLDAERARGMLEASWASENSADR